MARYRSQRCRWVDAVFVRARRNGKAMFRRLHLQIGGANIENPLRSPTLAASGEISGKRNPAVTIRA
jgi:hypothetical protein